MPTWFVSVANAGQISTRKTVIEFVVIRVFDTHHRLVPELDDAQQEVRMYEDRNRTKKQAVECSSAVNIFFLMLIGL